MTTIEALKALTPYPMPLSFLEAVCLDNGVEGAAEYTGDTALLPGFRYCRARVYQYLSIAPNVAQGGVTYSFSAEERKYFKNLAMQLFAEEGAGGGEYGYCGEDL